MSNLKPCPFCGEVPEIEHYDLPKGVIAHAITHTCLVRVSVGSAGDDPSSVVSAWNHRAGGWQPIETAPKDGRCLMLFQPKFNKPFLGYWDHENEQWQDWGDEWDVKRNPSHWMPMPEAPEVES